MTDDMVYIVGMVALVAASAFLAGLFVGLLA